MEYGACRDSITRLTLPEGSVLQHARATKGYEARQTHVNNFIQSDYDWLLMLDADMTFPEDTAERLMSHGKTFVSGYYLFRRLHPAQPIWFRPPEDGVWPLPPFVNDPERGRLHELGASGWGCVLLHRSVIEDTRAVLKGEWDVLEDDMDVWPYDLAVVMRAIRERDWQTLQAELRPLRGKYEEGGRVMGSDIRYGILARQAGHVLWGDPDVRCGHYTSWALHPDYYTALWNDQSGADKFRLLSELEGQMETVRAGYREHLAELVP